MKLGLIPGDPGLQTFPIKTLLGDLASPHSYGRSGNRGAVLGCGVGGAGEVRDVASCHRTL